MVEAGYEYNATLRMYQYGDPGTTLEEELERARNYHPFGTFAILKDGVWYEKGEMGWFACVSNEKDPGEWCGEVQQLWDEIPDDRMLVLVDCHI